MKGIPNTNYKKTQIKNSIRTWITENIDMGL